MRPTRNDLAYSVLENGYSVSECQLNPIPGAATNSVVNQLIAWSFRMCTARRGIDSILKSLGVELEHYLRDTFLTCDYQEEVEVYALSFPPDGFIEKTSEEEEDGCYVFEHSFEMTVFVLPQENRLRKLEVETIFSDSSFRDRLGESLMEKINTQIDFIGVDFEWEGFTNTEASVQDPDEEGDGFTGNALQANDAVAPPQKSSSPSTTIAVSAVLIAAALILIVVIVAVRRRRRNKRDSDNMVRVPLYDDDSQYGKSVHESSLYTSGRILRDLEDQEITYNESGDSEDHSSSGYTKAYVVEEREEESLAMMADDDVEVEFRGNASNTDGPVFVHVDTSHRTPIKKRGYYHNDTVDL